MAANEGAKVIGAFRDHALAEQAGKELRQSGWDESQIHTFGKHSSGDILSSLRQTLGGQHEDAQHSLTNLDQLDLSDEQRQFYQRELDAGYTIVAVEPRDRQLDAREILHHNGAYNVLLPAELGGKERVIPVRREEAQVRKEVVQTGEIRIHKRVITEHKTFTVPVTREEVVIERLPLEGRDARQSAADQQDAGNGYAVHHPIGMAGNVTEAADPSASESYRKEEARTRATIGYEDEMLKEGGTIRVFVREERVKIEKYPVIVEEIIVHKEVLQEEQHIVEPLRHEEISVERTGNFILHGDGFENATSARDDRRENAANAQ